MTSESANESASVSASVADEIKRQIVEAMDSVPDPCSMARGLNFGMAQMGMIRRVEVSPEGDGWSAVVQVRLTAPNCLYMGYFEKQTRIATADIPGLSVLHIKWDGNFDWTPDDLGDEAKVKLQIYHSRLEEQYKTFQSGDGALVGMHSDSRDGGDD